MRIILAAALLAACDGGASVKLQMSNDTVAARSNAAGDTVLELKLIAAYLAEDVDPISMNNTGQTQMVWLNPQCQEDISGCNVSGFAEPAGGPRITDFFDLARPSDEVNAELNSQERLVTPGSYRYARIEMCKSYDHSLPTDPMLRWRGGAMTASEPFMSGDCGRTSLAFDPPLEVADGDSVTVTLGYDLASAVVAGGRGAMGGNTIDGMPGYFRACVDLDDTHRVCMNYPDFAPSATKL